jgi:protein-S-isoprenylcysteine O-methyltransferase Ste14
MTVQPDPLHTTVFAILILCWAAYAAAFVFRKAPPKTSERRREPASIAGIVIQGVGFGLVWSVRRPLFGPMLPMGRPAEAALALLAVALAVASAWMTFSAVRVLGKQWSLAARLVEGHNLITAGPYRIVRHPIYTSMLGMLLATGLAVSRWPALVIAVVVFGIGTAIRVRIEERLLREAFPEEYAEYARRVPAVLPIPR